MLLLLARLDSQRPLEQRPVDLLVLASDAVHDARSVAPNRSIALEVFDGPGIPLVQGDDARLRQVLSNLVSNALQHTPADAAMMMTGPATSVAGSKGIRGSVASGPRGRASVARAPSWRNGESCPRSIAHSAVALEAGVRQLRLEREMSGLVASWLARTGLRLSQDRTYRSHLP